MTDWELSTDEFVTDDGPDFDDYIYHKPTRPAPPPPPPIYSLGSVTFEDSSDGKYFINYKTIFLSFLLICIFKF